MKKVEIVDETGVEHEVQVDSENAYFEMDDHSLFVPAVVEEVEYDQTNEISKTVKQSGLPCESTELRHEYADKPDLVIEGIATKDQLEPLKKLSDQRQPVFVSDLFSGSIAVSRVTIRQTTDTIYYTASGGKRKLAFKFHCQVSQQ